MFSAVFDPICHFYNWICGGPGGFFGHPPLTWSTACGVADIGAARDDPSGPVVNPANPAVGWRVSAWARVYPTRYRSPGARGGTATRSHGRSGERVRGPWVAWSATANRSRLMAFPSSAASRCWGVWHGPTRLRAPRSRPTNRRRARPAKQRRLLPSLDCRASTSMRTRARSSSRSSKPTGSMPRPTTASTPRGSGWILTMPVSKRSCGPWG